MFKHGRLDPQSDYHLKEVGDDAFECNLYHNNFKVLGAHLVGRKQGGNRCEIYLKFWTEKSSRSKSMMKSYIDKFKRAESLLLVPKLT